jgi:hypothetical protein
VYRFFINYERTKPKTFPIYPSCFRLWVTVDSSSGDKIECPEDSMYLAEGVEAPHQIIAWEVLHCPWYLDTE